MIAEKLFGVNRRGNFKVKIILNEINRRKSTAILGERGSWSDHWIDITRFLLVSCEELENWTGDIRIKLMIMDTTEVNWRRWTRVQPFGVSGNEEQGVIRLDILSLRSSLVVVADQELRSEVRILWQIGCDVLRRCKFGYECIEMIQMLACFNSTALELDVRVFESEESRTLVMMLKDVGFLTMRRIQSPSTISISTQFPALLGEIRKKNVAIDVEFLPRNIMILCSCRTRVLDQGQHWHELMTPIWKHALTYGIEFIRDNNYMWEDYLNDLLEHELHGLNDEQKEVLSKAVEIFDVEYGNMGWKTLELRFTQLRLSLRGELTRNGAIDTLLNHSKHYRLLVETVVMTSHPQPRKLFWSEIPSGNLIRFKLQQMAEFIYDKALQICGINSKPLLLEEALAYCTLGNNSWRSTIPDNDGDPCFSVSLKCRAQLGKLDEMVAFVREIREIIMRHGSCSTMPWFPDAVLQLAPETDGKVMILNELSIYLNHIYNMGRLGFLKEDYVMKSLIKCEGGLKKWDRILAIMRSRREYWRTKIIKLSNVRIQGYVEFNLGNWVQLESTLLDLVKTPTNDLVDELVNESLEFTKHLVEFRIKNGTYYEQYYLVHMDSSRDYIFKDPLVLVIKICLVKSRHEELLSYMLEYEKLLEGKYGDRVGPITNGILLFGECFRGQLPLIDQMNIGETFVELLRGLKATTQNRIAIISNHPTEKKSWMQGYADLISSDCDKYLLQN